MRQQGTLVCATVNTLEHGHAYAQTINSELTVAPTRNTSAPTENTLARLQKKLVCANNGYAFAPIVNTLVRRQRTSLYAMCAPTLDTMMRQQGALGALLRANEARCGTRSKKHNSLCAMLDTAASRKRLSRTRRRPWKLLLPSTLWDIKQEIAYAQFLQCSFGESTRARLPARASTLNKAFAGWSHEEDMASVSRLRCAATYKHDTLSAANAARLIHVLAWPAPLRTRQQRALLRAENAMSQQWALLRSCGPAIRRHPGDLAALGGK